MVAAGELPEALIVNPYHVEETADALYRAVTMPEAEQRDRMRSLRATVRTRRDLVTHRVAAANQLRAHLQLVFPGAVGLFADIDSAISLAFLERFPGRVLNLHPALPGQFAGTHAIERALHAFRRGEIIHTGVMVHQVVPQVDAGPVIATVEVPIHVPKLPHRDPVAATRGGTMLDASDDTEPAVPQPV